MGGATSRLFAAEGAKVVIADVLDKEGAALAEELKGSAIFQHHDVTDEASWSSVVAKAIATSARSTSWSTTPASCCSRPCSTPARRITSACWAST